MDLICLYTQIQKFESYTISILHLPSNPNWEIDIDGSTTTMDPPYHLMNLRIQRDQIGVSRRIEQQQKKTRNNNNTPKSHWLCASFAQKTFIFSFVSHSRSVYFTRKIQHRLRTLGHRKRDTVREKESEIARILNFHSWKNQARILLFSYFRLLCVSFNYISHHHHPNIHDRESKSILSMDFQFVLAELNRCRCRCRRFWRPNAMLKTECQCDPLLIFIIKANPSTQSQYRKISLALIVIYNSQRKNRHILTVVKKKKLH